MKLVRQTKLALKEGNSDKVYEVDLCESGDKFLVNFRYGRRGAELKEGTKTPSAVSREEADKIFQKLVDEKTRKGYHETVSGGAEAVEKPKKEVDLTYDAAERNAKIVEKLSAPNAKSHPQIDRVIWRAGELQIKEAAPHIEKFIGTAKELRDYCCAWALGQCGDENSLPALEQLSAHQSEAVRRIAFEARLKLAPNPQNLIDEKINSLPDEAKKILTDFKDSEKGNEELAKFLQNTLRNHKTGALTLLQEIYSVAPPKFRSAVCEILRTIPVKAKLFKPLRHIFKIAEFRRDAEVYGILAKRFETENAKVHSPSWGDNIYLYDENGRWKNFNYKNELRNPDASIAFTNKTKNYLMRRSWRTLRRLGEIGDENYVRLAVGVLLNYTDADAVAPSKNTLYDYYHTGSYDWRNPKITEIHYDVFAPYPLLNHILYENSLRYELKPGTTLFRMREGHQAGESAPEVREEAFPKLWEQQPVGLLHLISESRCRPVHEFASKALRDCPEFLESLDLDAIKMMLSRPYEATARLGFDLAKKFYDPQNPNTDLILMIAFSKNAEARRQGFRWIEENRNLFAKDASMLLKILANEEKEVREFGKKLVAETSYSETEAQNLAAVLIAEIVSFTESKAEIATDFGQAIFAGFAEHLKKINLNVALDLLRHPLVGVQFLGAKILSNHETPAEDLPNDLISSLIASPHAEIRTVGVEIFGKLSDENLLRREDVIMEFLAHELVDVHAATRPIVKRLAEKSRQFAENITNDILIKLIESESSEGFHARMFEALKDIPNWQKYAGYEAARLLTKGSTTIAQDAGGMILRENADEFAKEVSVEDLLDFTNNEVVSVRKISWEFAEKNVESLKEEVSELIRALDTKFDDSRDFWHGFFRDRLTEKELTPDVLVAISDSVKPATQKLGRDLLLKYFKAENGTNYLLKLSEHPAPNMQLFATNYLENHAADSPEKLAKLAPYFIRVLSLVNRARTAKDRSLNFLETEGLKSPESAKIVADIFARQSATTAIGDRARMIKTMVKIRQKYPSVEMPINIKSAEVRVNAV